MITLTDNNDHLSVIHSPARGDEEPVAISAQAVQLAYLTDRNRGHNAPPCAPDAGLLLHDCSACAAQCPSPNLKDIRSIISLEPAHPPYK